MSTVCPVCTGYPRGTFYKVTPMPKDGKEQNKVTHAVVLTCRRCPEHARTKLSKKERRILRRAGSLQRQTTHTSNTESALQVEL